MVNPTADASAFDIVNLKKFGISAQSLIGQLKFSAPQCLVHTNFLQVNEEFGHQHIRDLYVSSQQTIPGVDLWRLPMLSMLAVEDAEDFVLFTDTCFLQEQVRPGWGLDDLQRVVRNCGAATNVGEETLLIARYGIRTWGHWLVELLPKAVCAEAAFPGRFRFIVPDCLVTDPKLGTMLEALQAYGISRDRLMLVHDRGCYRFDNLYYVSPICYHDVALHPLIAKQMRRVIDGDVAYPEYPENVAFLRREMGIRNLLNINEIVSYLRSCGWAIVDIGNVPFREQMRYFRAAKRIVSILGSGLSGLIYSPDNVSVLTMAPSNWGDLFFFRIMQERHARLADVRGRPVLDCGEAGRQAFEIQISDLEMGLRMLDAPTRASPVHPPQPREPTRQSVVAVSESSSERHRDSGPKPAHRSTNNIRGTRIISWAPSGWIDSWVAELTETHLLTLVCGDDFYAVRLGFANNSPTPWWLSAASVAPSSTLGDRCNPTDNNRWHPVTFAAGGRPVDDVVDIECRGPTSIEIPGSTDAVAVQWAWSDWIPVRSLPRLDQVNGPRVLMIRSLLEAGTRWSGANGGFLGYAMEPSINHGIEHVSGRYPKDEVTFPGFIPPSDAELGHPPNPVACVQFLTRNSGLVGITTGDSHHQGTSTTAEFHNYLLQATTALAAEKMGRIPFGMVNCAQGGFSSLSIFRRLCCVLPVIKPTYAILPGWSYNEIANGGRADQEAVDAFLTHLLMAAEVCRKHNIIPIFLTPFPRNRADLDDHQREAWHRQRETILSFRKEGALVIDASEILGQPVDGRPDVSYRVGLSHDNAHPNDTGHAAIAMRLKEIILEILEESGLIT